MAKKYTEIQNHSRHALLGIPFSANYDVKRFEGVDLAVLKALKAKKFVEMDECQNDSPTIGEFMKFMETEGKDIQGLKAMGYIVTNDREDRRISLEGLTHTDNRASAVDTFRKFCANADELSSCRAWWD